MGTLYKDTHENAGHETDGIAGHDFMSCNFDGPSLSCPSFSVNSSDVLIWCRLYRHYRISMRLKDNPTLTKCAFFVCMLCRHFNNSADILPQICFTTLIHSYIVTLNGTETQSGTQSSTFVT